MSRTVAELRPANEALDDAEELRRRLNTEGYLFFRRLQDPGKLLALRRDITGVLMQGGWLQPGTDPMEGIARPGAQCTEGDLEYTEVYHQVYRLESFHRSGHWPEVISLIAKLAGEPVLPHPQKIARLWFPKYTEHTTPTHQDFVHGQGSYDTYTCWAPVGDCPLELGGLAVLAGSHRLRAIRDHHFSLGAGGLAVDESRLEGQWLSTNYEIGDSLIFNSLMVHQALPNLSEDRLRISLDNRYQHAGLPIAEHMLQPHLQGLHPLSWEEVYAGWQSDELKYYWKQHDLQILPRLLTWAEQGFAQALELAGGGDTRALHHLRRLVKRDPHSEQAQRAQTVLAAHA
ncbi:MAG: phytanoyl-CoA dioxygenase family protein [Candidatus Latescibacteria bacterium]|nr:phytanoyl-CoA dioxygenase family protein [Candidatus Latescibacterota bacterium]